MRSGASHRSRIRPALTRSLTGLPRHLAVVPRHLIRYALGAVLVAGLLAGQASPASAAEPYQPPPTQQDPFVAAHELPGTAPATVSTGRPLVAPAPAWPSAGQAEVDLAAASRRAAAGPPRAGTLPVLVGPPATGTALNTRTRVELYDRGTATRAGLDGLLLRLRPTDAGAAPGRAAVTVEYGGFRHAYGADWANRLRLVAVPPCAVDTPGAAGCAVTPLPSSNNTRAGRVTADVDVAPDAGTLVALVADESGATGDFSATDLQPSSNWSAGGNTGGFSWSYPMRMPPGLGGPEPELGLGYSSASVDGRMAASNNQPSWVGEGFDWQPGFIERRYQPCAEDRRRTGANNGSGPVTGDLCWATDNAILSFGEHSAELIRGSGNRWYGRSDDGSRIELRTGAGDANAGDGDNNGEHWVVTTTDGTQYWFGRNQLPGWAAGRAETDATYTVPVYGNHSGEPCYNASFASSVCEQAWRWNLDHVVDPFGNTMSYWYTKEENRYARGGSATTLARYERGGNVERIDYGTRGDTAYGTAPVQVDIITGDRCTTTTCATHNSANWPDTPWDLQCTASPCYIGSPTFWSTRRLAKVVTQLRSGTTYQPVESWTLTHTFPNPGDGTRAGLWLDRISHAGHVGVPANQPTAVPDVTFVGTQLHNRVDTTDLSPAMNWWRIASINTETGGSINVTYSNDDGSPQNCVARTRMPAAPETNTMRCYPVLWTPPGASAPVTDYFHKYLVVQVTESDQALPVEARSPRTITRYEYVGNPAWHYADEDGMTRAPYQTWSGWRGYERVRVTTGDGTDRTQTETLYFRGMHGDRLTPSGGTRTVSVTASADAGVPAVPDEDVYAGMPREEIVYNGPGGAVVEAVVTDPWQSASLASRTINGVTVHARRVDVAGERTRTALDAGRGWRRTTARTTFDDYGFPAREEDLGDDAVTGDEQCAITTYVRNTTTPPGGAPTIWLVEYPGREQTFAATCARVDQGGLTADHVITDDRISYDALAWNAAPTKGGVTRVEELKSYTNGTPGYVTAERAVYDAYGRPTSEWDIKNNLTTTAYTHTAGGQLATVRSTNHLTWVTTTTLEPAWGVEKSVVDPNNRRTDQTYDGLGRVTAVWLPNRDKAANETPNQRFTYAVRNTNASAVTTETLRPDTGYVTTVAFFDAHLRPRQTQAPEAGPDGRRVVTDTLYDSAGRVVKSNQGQIQTGAPSAAQILAPLPDAQVPTQILTDHDGTGRETSSITRRGDQELWRTTTAYAGDRVDVTPPAGATATSTVMDTRGNTVQLREYRGATPTGDYDATSHRYDAKDQLVETRDAAGNVWTYGYDLRGNQIRADDPDKGLTTMTYNDAGELLTAADTRGETIAYVPDSLGRITSMHDDTPTGVKRAEWVYDTLAKGQLTLATRWVGPDAYTTETLGYTDDYQPTGTRTIVPVAAGALAGTYQYGYTYRADGSPATMSLPAAGGLPAETLTYDYNHVGLPTTVRTTLSAGDEDTFYVNGTSYTAYGEVSLIGRRHNDGRTLGTAYHYEAGSRRLKQQITTRQVSPTAVSDTQYAYDPAGNVTKIWDQAGDNQCFRYDHHRRLTEAWTPANGACATAPSVPGLGGPAEYWQSFTYDAGGNRQTATDHTDAGNTVRTHRYPQAGADRPHTVNQVETTGVGGPRTDTYTYDNAGNTRTRPGTGGTQTLTWNAEGQLDTVTGAGADSSYFYDAAGNRLISREPEGRTLYLPGQDVFAQTAGGTAATRYYTLGGRTIGQRTPAGVVWLDTDHQGTVSATVAATDAQPVSLRRQAPFGTPRGAAPAWPNDRGFVGGTKDATGLTHLGAREYDPGTGRFLSDDPVTDGSDSQQMHGYAYANNTPVTLSDPSGLKPNRDKAAARKASARKAPAKRQVKRAKPAKKRSFTRGDSHKKRARAERSARSDARRSVRGTSAGGRSPGGQGRKLVNPKMAPQGKSFSSELNRGNSADCGIPFLNIDICHGGGAAESCSLLNDMLGACDSGANELDKFRDCQGVSGLARAMCESGGSLGGGSGCGSVLNLFCAAAGAIGWDNVVQGYRAGRVAASAYIQQVGAASFKAFRATCNAATELFKWRFFGPFPMIRTGLRLNLLVLAHDIACFVTDDQINNHGRSPEIMAPGPPPPAW